VAEKNVLFYDNPATAIKYGFRPCKICHPMQTTEKTPEYIQNIIKELNQNPYLNLKDYNLRQRDIDPAKIRRCY